MITISPVNDNSAIGTIDQAAILAAKLQRFGVEMAREAGNPRDGYSVMALIDGRWKFFRTPGAVHRHCVAIRKAA